MSSNNGGSLIGSDLYNYIIDDDATVDYICIKDFFAEGENAVNYGTGKIETMEDSVGHHATYNTMFATIAADVADWLNVRNTAKGKDYATISEAIEAGGGFTNQNLVTRYTADFGTPDWNDYWV